MIFNVIYAKRKKHVRIYWFYHLSRRCNNPASLTLLQKKRTTASATEGRPSSGKQAPRKRYSSRWSPPMDLRRAAILMTSNASRRWQIYSDNRQIIMETFNNVINSGQLVLVDFFATWCQPCKAMHPILEQVKSVLGDHIRIIKVDVDKNRIKE